jgi:hypothetical protein
LCDQSKLQAQKSEKNKQMHGYMLGYVITGHHFRALNSGAGEPWVMIKAFMED